MLTLRIVLLWILAVSSAHSKPPKTLIVYDDLPTTLNPLYAKTMADARAHELIYERLFFTTPIS
jgi:hypothetical protein